jgi:hypothetical protein
MLVAERVVDFLEAIEVQHEERGGLTSRLGARDRLVDALAYLDASADFPEDEIPPADVGAALGEAAARLDAKIQTGLTPALAAR